METLARGLTWFVAAQHFGFFLIEAVFWTSGFGRRVFRTTPEFAKATRALAANQGLYNGFLAAGLAWAPTPDVRAFFLGCVIVAGIFGAFTVSWRILVVQAGPAALALALFALAS